MKSTNAPFQSENLLLLFSEKKRMGEENTLLVNQGEARKKYAKFKSSLEREQLIVKYSYLVSYCVRRISMFLPSHIDTDDLNGEGIIGLIDAIEKYNPDKGTEFPTYAMTRIRGSIIDSLRQKDWVPRNIREMEKDIEKAKSYLEHKNGRTPTLPELAEYMGLALQKLSYYLNKIKSAEVLSLEEIMRLSGPQGGNSTRTIGNGEPSIERQVEKKERQQILKNAISDLKPREKLILSLYYYEELSLKEIHQILGISMPRISQIHKNVLKKLRSALTPNEELMIS